MESLNEFLLLI